MTKYLIQYMLDGVWVSANIMATSIYDALDWSKANIQPTGIAVTNINDKFVKEEEKWLDWFLRR